MNQKLKLVFSKTQNRVLISVDGVAYGYFTLIEKAVKQIFEFRKDNHVNDIEAIKAINQLLDGNSLKTKYKGDLSLVFSVSRLFPDYILESSGPALESHVILGYLPKEKKHYFFLLRDDGSRTQLSEDLYYKFEAYDFLEFMLKISFINKDRFDALELAIRSSILYGSCRIAMLN